MLCKGDRRVCNLLGLAFPLGRCHFWGQHRVGGIAEPQGVGSVTLPAEQSEPLKLQSQHSWWPQRGTRPPGEEGEVGWGSPAPSSALL